MTFVYEKIRKYMRITAVLTSCAFICACAAPVSKYKTATKAEINSEIRLQKEMVIRAYYTEQNHLKNITFQIIRANAEFCKEDAMAYGFTFWNIDSPGKNNEHKEVAEELYKLDHVFQVDLIYENTEEQTANIQSGDKIIAINDIDVSTKPVKIKDIYKAYSKTGTKRPAKLLLLRGNQEIEVETSPYKVCNYPLRYDDHDNTINAYANGHSIIMTRGFYKFTKSDEELAIVLAHEIGHNIMRHIDKSEENSALGQLANIALYNALKATDFHLPDFVYHRISKHSQNIYSVDFEREADYIGLYFAERAGYNTSNSINLWRRIAVEIDAGKIDTRSSHPATAERFVYIKKTLEEIREKRRKGRPLIPEIDWDKTSEKDIHFIRAKPDEDKNTAEE